MLSVIAGHSGVKIIIDFKCLYYATHFTILLGVGAMAPGSMLSTLGGGLNILEALRRKRD